MSHEQKARTPEEQAELQKLIDKIPFDKNSALYGGAHMQIVQAFDMQKSQESKPREFWLQLLLNEDFVYTERPEYDISALHVIEYSALEKAQAEIKRLKAANETMFEQLKRASNRIAFIRNGLKELIGPNHLPGSQNLAHYILAEDDKLADGM